MVFSLQKDERVAATGTYLWGGSFECDLRIVFSRVRYGSGDYYDDPDVREDADVDTWYVQYGSTTQRGIFNAGGGGYPSLAEARAAAEAAPGIGATVRWNPHVA